MVADDIQEVLLNLIKYKELSLDTRKHKEILTKAALYAAILTDHDDLRVVRTCLDVFENLLSNQDCYGPLSATFGVYESLEALAIKTRRMDEDVSERAAKLADLLRDYLPPAFNTRSKKRYKRQTLYVLSIAELSAEVREKIENALLGIRGIVSFLIDLDAKRCCLRICPKTPVKEIVEKLYRKCGLKCLIVCKQPSGIETLCDILDNTVDRSYLEYPEDNNKSGVLATKQRPGENESCGFLGALKSFCTESFYW